MLTLTRPAVPVSHAYLWNGDRFECHSGRTGEVYELTVAQERRHCKVIDCGCTGWLYRGYCSHSRQLEADLNSRKKKGN